MVDKIYLCFDTETSGLPTDWSVNGLHTPSYKNARLIEIGCVLFTFNKDGELTILEKYSSLTDYLMNEEEFKKSGPIHNITNEMLIKDGKPVKEVLLKFKELYKKADYLLAHNIEFDVNILLNEYNLINDNFRYTLMDNKDKLLCSCHYKLSLGENGIISEKRERFYKIK